MSERSSFIDKTDLITGEDYPKFDSRLEPDRELAMRLSPRLKSLLWVADKQPSAFAPALFSFSKRHKKARSTSALLPTEGWSILACVPVIDHLREPLAANWNPLEPISTWPRALFGAVDDVVEVMWLLRVGLTIPAALSARTLLERWTHNVANHHSVDRAEGEADADYISRVWQTYSPYGVPAHVGSWWGTLSEIVHGRQTAGRLGKHIVGAVSMETAANTDIHRGICAVVELCLRQIRGGLTVIVEEASQEKYVPALQAQGPALPAGHEPFDLSEAYEDLDYFEAHRILGERWTQLAAIYRERVKDPDGHLTRQFDLVLTVECLLERRGRAIEGARAAFAVEKELLGDDFDPGYLAARLFRYACFAELARLMAAEEVDAEQSALLAASQCLEAAVHAWLEDSDQSMGYVRVALEQAARLRVHRLKRTRGIRMEARGDVSASRWLAEAGWGRLGVLMRATNEFAHLGVRTRRHGAREALRRVQMGEPQEETSRGKALDSVAHLLAFELHDRLREKSEAAASCFTDSVTLLDQENYLRTLERFLNHAQSLKDFSFGAPDFE